MKKLLLLTLLSLSMISLAACGNKSEESESVAEVIVPEKETEEAKPEVDTDLPEVITEETEEVKDKEPALVLIATELHIFNETDLDLNGMVLQPTGPVDASKAQTFTGAIADEAHGTMDYLLSSEATVLDIIATDADGNEITFTEVDFSKIKATGTGKDGVDEAEATLYLEVEEGDDDELIYTARVELGVEE